VYIQGRLSEQFSELKISETTFHYCWEIKRSFNCQPRISGGFWNNFYSHRRLSECPNQLSEEGHCMEGFLQLVSDFTEESIGTAKNCGKPSALKQKVLFRPFE
jgi:hypothetical protein